MVPPPNSGPSAAAAAGVVPVGIWRRLAVAAPHLGALVYGFARMNIDGHFPRWGIADAEAGRMAEAILDLFIEGIAAQPGATPRRAR